MESTIIVQIDHDKCIGCGKCVADCPSHVLALQKGKTKCLNDNCLKCGHCFAICPTTAIAMDGLDDDVLNKTDVSGTLNPDILKAHLKLRRSVRQYKQVPVDKDMLDKIIEAGRLTPSGSNKQNVRYIVLQKEVEPLEDMVLAQYKKLRPLALMIGRFLNFPDISKYKFERGFLFFNAPVVILVISESGLNAGLAAMNMELMAESLGLGALYVGLFSAPANRNKAVRKTLGLTKKEKIVTCLAIGHPAVQYLRSAPKKSVNVIWR